MADSFVEEVVRRFAVLQRSKTHHICIFRKGKGEKHKKETMRLTMAVLAVCLASSDAFYTFLKPNVYSCFTEELPASRVLLHIDYTVWPTTLVLCL